MVQFLLGVNLKFKMPSYAQNKRQQHAIATPIEDTAGNFTGTEVETALAELAASGGIGTPVSSTDNAIVRWDGVAADTLQDSGILVDDSDDISGIDQNLSFVQESINIGGGTHGTIGTSCLAVGYDAVASGVNSTAVGHSTDATGIDSTCFGTGAQATGQDSSAFGKGAVCSAQAAVAFGSESVASTAIGASAFGAAVIASAQNATAVGRTASASGVSSIAMGPATNASSSGALALGQAAACTAANSLALGQNSDATATGTVALGSGSQATHLRGIAIGQNATTTATFQCVIGGAVAGPEEIYIGDGVTYTAPNTSLVITSCGGSGTDIGATTVILAAGKNTGSSTTSKLKLQTPDSTTTGTTLQTLADRIVIDTDGLITFGSGGEMTISSTGSITSNADTATDFIFGQVALTDSVGNDWATLAAYDFRDTTGWMLSQYQGAGASNGKTFLNGDSGITDALAFASGQSSRWNLEGVGHWRPSANNTYDFCSSSFRLRAIYIGDQVDFNGGITLNRTAVAAGAYTALVTDYIIAKTGITGGGDTITLPAAATAGEGRQYIIKDESGGAATDNITIDGNGAETIDGATTVAINQNYGAVSLYCTGSAWMIT